MRWQEQLYELKRVTGIIACDKEKGKGTGTNLLHAWGKRIETDATTRQRSAWPKRRENHKAAAAPTTSQRELSELKARQAQLSYFRLLGYCSSSHESSVEGRRTFQWP